MSAGSKTIAKKASGEVGKLEGAISDMAKLAKQLERARRDIESVGEADKKAFTVFKKIHDDLLKKSKTVQSELGSIGQTVKKLGVNY
ncbi:MAG: hypothetical protein AAFR79_09480 [Pseudomonadota bacterium]